METFGSILEIGNIIRFLIVFMVLLILLMIRQRRETSKPLWKSQSYLGHYYRRMRARHGTAKAITATAHKLARIDPHLLKTGKTYDETIFTDQEILHRKRLERNLKKQANFLRFQRVPVQSMD